MDLGAPLGQPMDSKSNGIQTHQTVPVTTPSASRHHDTPPTYLDTASNGYATGGASETNHVVRNHPPVYAAASASAPVATEPYQPVHPKAQPATAQMDPEVPSSESAPTALPTNPSTHPEEQKQAIKDEHPATVAREVEKTKGEERELKGEAPEGTIVAGLEDDRIYTMLRRFDTVSLAVLYERTELIWNSKSPMSFIQRRNSHRPNRTYDLQPYRTSPPTRTF